MGSVGEEWPQHTAAPVPAFPLVLSCLVLLYSVWFYSASFCPVWFCSVWFCPVWFCPVPFGSILFYPVWFSSVWFYPVLFCLVLSCLVLACLALSCLILSCLVLSYFTLHPRAVTCPEPLAWALPLDTRPVFSQVHCNHHLAQWIFSKHTFVSGFAARFQMSPPFCDGHCDNETGKGQSRNSKDNEWNTEHRAHKRRKAVTVVMEGIHWQAKKRCFISSGADWSWLPVAFKLTSHWKQMHCLCLFTRVSVHREWVKSHFYSNLGGRIEQGQICHKDTEAKILVTKFQKMNKFRRSIKNCKPFKLKPKKHLMSCKEKQNLVSEQRFSWGEIRSTLLIELLRDM